MSPSDNYTFRDLPPILVSRGAAYQRQGRVRLTLKNGAVAARVRGTRNYEVTLRYIDGTLVTSCTCPFAKGAEGGESVCKHAVAAAIEASLEADVPRGSDIRLVAQDDPVSPTSRALATRGESAADLARRLKGSGVTLASKLGKAGTAKPAPSPAARRPEWMSLLDGIRPRPASTTQTTTPSLIPRTEFRFVLDCEASARPPHLSIKVHGRQPLLSGAMGRWTKLDLKRDELALISDAPMRAALALVAATAEMHHSYSIQHAHVPDSISPPHGRAAAILHALIASGALFALPAGSDAEPIGPLSWDDGAPWELAAELERSSNGRGKTLRFTAHLRRGTERRSLDEPLLLLAAGLVVFKDNVAPLRHHGAFGLISKLRDGGALNLPLAQRTDFLSRLLASVPDLPLSVPPELALEIHSGKPLHHAVLSPIGELRTGAVQVELSHEYDGITPEPFSAETFIDHARERVIRRDLEAETRAAEFLRQLGVATKRHYSRTQGYRSLPSLSSKRVPSLVRALVGAGWKVEAEGVRYRAPSNASSSITSGIDWFDLKGDVEFDGQIVALPALLQALERGDGLMRLGDGSFGLLPEEWLRRFGSLAKLGRAVQDRIRFTRAQGGLLDALLAEMPDLNVNINVDAAFAKARQELRRFEGVEAADAPARFVGTLREYQRQGLGWMKGLRQLGLGGVLADDMGLGKTVQVLALLAGLPPKKDKKPSLVVAPRSLIFNWQEEARRFAPKLRVLDHSGTERSSDARSFGGHDLILTTYGTLRRDILLLREVPFDIIVLDEAQAIKNAASETAKAARLLNAQQRLALSGTPIENHLGELWSLFEFLNPGVLGTSTAFAKIANPGRDVDDDTLRLIGGAVRPFVLRRTKKQVAPELPERVEQTLTCILGDKQRAVYDELRDHYREVLRGGLDARGIKSMGIEVIEALLRLRQAACHPALINPRWKDSPSTKLDLLIPELQDVLAEDHAALVFSQFTGLLALVRARLDALGIGYCYLDGSMPAKARQAQVKRFQDGGPPLFLISLKAGGLGLNLTRAEYVYLLDPWWNPAVEAQAIDRAHRIGQRNTVLARRLVAKDTVEERILELQARKRELADAILSSDGSVLGRLTREELEHLLS